MTFQVNQYFLIFLVISIGYDIFYIRFSFNYFPDGLSSFTG